MIHSLAKFLISKKFDKVLAKIKVSKYKLFLIYLHSRNNMLVIIASFIPYTFIRIFLVCNSGYWPSSLPLITARWGQIGVLSLVLELWFSTMFCFILFFSLSALTISSFNLFHLFKTNGIKSRLVHWRFFQCSVKNKVKFWGFFSFYFSIQSTFERQRTC